MSKKQLVILTHICYPIPSAVGRISLQFADYLKQNYNIRIIALQDGKHKMNGDDLNGSKIYTISQWRLKFAQISAENRSKYRGYKRVLWSIIYFLLRALGRLQASFFTIDNLWWYKKKAFKLLLKLNSEKKIETVISFNCPIETHLAVYEYKKINKDTRWICYWGDLFASPNFKLNLFLTINKMQRIEKRIIEASDVSMMTEEIVNILRTRTNSPKKVISIPYGINEKILLDSNVYNSRHLTNSDRVIFLCMGSFYRKFRNPEKMLKAFASAENDIFELDLYTAGECQDIVDKYVKASKGKIHQYGLIPYTDLVKKLYNADFLINIENNVEYCNPSKLFELISFRKPIIDFSYGNKTNLILDKYPLVLRIDYYDDYRIIFNQIKDFVRYSRGKMISEEIIRSTYTKNLESSIKELIRESV